MNEDFMRTIVINGMKVDVDMRTARKIDEFRVGDNVRILHTDKDYNGEVKQKVKNGVITDFANFQDLPTIVIAEIASDYTGVDIQFVYYNEKSEGLEITYMSEEEAKISEKGVIELFNHKIEEAQNTLDKIKYKKNFFIKHFLKGYKEISTDD